MMGMHTSKINMTTIGECHRNYCFSKTVDLKKRKVKLSTHGKHFILSYWNLLNGKIMTNVQELKPGSQESASYSWIPLTHMKDFVMIESTMISQDHGVGVILDEALNIYMVLYIKNGNLEFEQMARWLTKASDNQMMTQISQDLGLGMDVLFIRTQTEKEVLHAPKGSGWLINMPYFMDIRSPFRYDTFIPIMDNIAGFKKERTHEVLSSYQSCDHLYLKPKECCTLGDLIEQRKKILKLNYDEPGYLKVLKRKRQLEPSKDSSVDCGSSKK